MPNTRYLRWLLESALPLLCLLLLPLVVSGYMLSVFSRAGVWIILTLSLNLLVGYTRQLSIAHCTFMGVGAYTTAILSHHLATPWPLAMLGGVLASAVAGLLLSIPCSRLSGPYLAVATLAFALAMPELLLKWESVTGGFSGLAPQPASLFGTPMTLVHLYYLVAIGLLVSVALTRNIIASHVGRAFAAVRDSEYAAQAMGIHLGRYRVLAFTISAAMAGLAGGLYVYLVGRISPGEFSFWASVFVLVAVIVGGERSILGSVLGGLFITFVPHWTSSLAYLPSIIFGAALTGVIFLYPGGLATVFARIRTNLVARTPNSR